MPVTEISHGMRIEPNHVYVGIPGHDVFLRKRTLGLQLRDKRAAIDGQIDKFLTSLGSECGRTRGRRDSVWNRLRRDRGAP